MSYKQKIIDTLVENHISTEEEIQQFTLLHGDIKETYAFIVWRFTPGIMKIYSQILFYNFWYKKIYEILKTQIKTNSSRILESIKSKLEKEYYLVNVNWEDYSDSLELIQHYIDTKSKDIFFDNMEFIDNHIFDSIDFIIWELPLTKEERLFIKHDENWEIVSIISERDTSEPIQEMLSNTTINVRITLNSNYDCMNSNYFMNQCGYQYDGIFKQIIDALNLNPATVHFHMTKAGFNIYGKFPDFEERNDQEYVSYEHFISELDNSIWSCNHLTFIWKLNAGHITEKDSEEFYEVTIPKGNVCGLFDSTTWSWSLIECVLLKDFTVTIAKELEGKYDFYSLEIDDLWVNGYWIHNTYWLTQSAWWKNISIK